MIRLGNGGDGDEREEGGGTGGDTQHELEIASGGQEREPLPQGKICGKKRDPSCEGVVGANAVVKRHLECVDPGGSTRKREFGIPRVYRSPPPTFCSLQRAPSALGRQAVRLVSLHVVVGYISGDISHTLICARFG